MAQVQQSISSSDIGDILEKSLSGIKLEKDDCIRMLRSPDVHLMGMVAGHLTQKLYGKRAYNLSVDARFIPGHDEAYTLLWIDAICFIRQALQGGHNADFQ